MVNIYKHVFLAALCVIITDNTSALQISQSVRKALNGQDLELSIYRHDIADSDYEISNLEMSVGGVMVYTSGENAGCCAVGGSASLACTYRTCNGIYIYASGNQTVAVDKSKAVIYQPKNNRHIAFVFSSANWNRLFLSSVPAGVADKAYSRAVEVDGGILRGVDKASYNTGDIKIRLGRAVCLPFIMEEKGVGKGCRHMSLYAVGGYKYTQWYGGPSSPDGTKRYIFMQNLNNRIAGFYVNKKDTVDTTAANYIVYSTDGEKVNDPQAYLLPSFTASLSVGAKQNEVAVGYTVMNGALYYGVGLEVFCGGLYGFCYGISIDCLVNDKVVLPKGVDVALWDRDTEFDPDSIGDDEDDLITYNVIPVSGKLLSKNSMEWKSLWNDYRLSAEEIKMEFTIEVSCPLYYQALNGNSIGAVFKIKQMSRDIYDRYVYQDNKKAFGERSIYVGIILGLQV